MSETFKEFVARVSTLAGMPAAEIPQTTWEEARGTAATVIAAYGDPGDQDALVSVDWADGPGSYRMIWRSRPRDPAELAELARLREERATTRQALAELRDAAELQSRTLANVRAEVVGQRGALAGEKRARLLAVATAEQRSDQIECLTRALVAAGHELLVSDRADVETAVE